MTNRIQTFLQLLIEIEASGVGYNQAKRTSFFDKVTKQILRGKETDCSALTLYAYWLAGYPVDVSGEVYTGNAKLLLVNAGFAAIDVRGKTAAQIRPLLKPADSVVGPGHIIAVGSDGIKILSAEKDERGQASGGQPGDQTGVEVLWRPQLYDRSAGWEWILRPPAEPTSPTSTGFTHRVRWANTLNVREKPTETTLGPVIATVRGGISGARCVMLSDTGVLVKNPDGATAWWRKVIFEGTPPTSGWVNVNYLQPLS